MPYKSRKRNREYQRKWKKDQTARHRKRAFEILGDKCAYCGYNENTHALQIDHIEPIHRKEPNRRGGKDRTQHIQRKLSNGDIGTENLQLLCANCHAIKTIEKDLPNYNYRYAEPQETPLDLNAKACYNGSHRTFT